MLAAADLLISADERDPGMSDSCISSVSRDDEAVAFPPFILADLIDPGSSQIRLASLDLIVQSEW